MTEEQIRALLAVAMAYDNRRPGDAALAAWTEAATRGRWTFRAALDALHAHYAETTVWVMPGHITARLNADRRQPPPTDAIAELPAGPPTGPETFHAIIGQLAQRLGWTRGTTTPEDTRLLAVDCPHCHAGPGRPCSRLATRGPRRGQHVPLSGVHPSRRDIAAGRNPTGNRAEPPQDASESRS
jgi:hypothetical protein